MPKVHAALHTLHIYGTYQNKAVTTFRTLLQGGCCLHNLTNHVLLTGVVLIARQGTDARF